MQIMKIDSIAKWVERFTSPPCKWLHWIAMVALLLLMFMTVGDVIGRYMVGIIPGFGPIPGAFELTEFMLAIAVLTAIGYTEVKGAHISIDLVVNRFPPRAQAIIDSVTNFLSLAIFVLVTWQTIKYAQLLFSSHDVSAVLRLPVYPFLLIAAIGSFMFCLAMLSSFLRSLKKVIKK
jgi:TRAP-type C4-dicarboxylate transport system permease small subunit